MPTIVGVKLPFAGKALSFDPAGLQLAEGDAVIVSTERGQEFGHVVAAPHDVPDTQIVAPLKPVLRVADEDDVAKVERFAAREREEMETFRRLITKHQLDMKPIGVEHLFDDSKTVFYFAAEERVDFRELVRDLASEFHTRVDMRQIGVRDEARIVGGLGHCGQPLCCVRFAGEFQPVSIRMAKEQDLPLNPLKISGLCGRLMCCLRYEYDTYKEFKSRAPKCGSPVVTPMGDGKVVSLDVPREKVTIKVPGSDALTVPLEALDCSAGRGCPCVLKADALPAPPERDVLSAVGVSAGSLREAAPSEDGDGDGGGGGASGPQRRSRRSKRGGESGAKPAEQPQKQRQQPKQDKAAPAEGTGGSAGGRKRRRRRPRGGGAAGTNEGGPT